MSQLSISRWLCSPKTLYDFVRRHFPVITMCGIVAAVSTHNIVPILIEGLKRLEYRGYDSCGVAVHQDGELRRARSTARVSELEAHVEADHIQAGTGIAHTRWATHGAPAVHTAPPHFSHGPRVSADESAAACRADPNVVSTG